MKTIKTPVLIIGAGPAGCTASYELSKLGVQHIILEKDVFPRDKVCGDALSGKVMAILRRCRPEIMPEFLDNREIFIPSPGIRFYGPNLKHVDIPFPPNDGPEEAGYVAKRYGFDNLLVKYLDSNFCTLYQATKDFKIGDQKSVTFSIGEEEYKVQYDIIIGADGARSKTAEHFVGRITDKSHHSAAVRAYYKNVGGFHNNFVELHFIKDLLPGYFWVFPLPNNEVNVGLGMLSSKVGEGKVNLRNRLQEIIKTHPTLKDRFKDAELVGNIKGWGLPLGSKKRQLAGDSFMLTGDAGWLIDPFTGEGIGNACVSGQLAGQYAAKALEQGDFTLKVLKEYEDHVYRKTWDELVLSHRLQKLSSIKWLFNFLINKATSSRKLQETMTLMYTDLDMRSKLKNPFFYLSLLRKD